MARKLLRIFEPLEGVRLFSKPIESHHPPPVGSAITARPFVRYIQAVDVLEAETDCPEK
jgi:hypothetical protein